MHFWQYCKIGEVIEAQHDEFLRYLFVLMNHDR